MKLFNTIQELWDYCKFCPICTRNCREVIVSVGPERFILVDHLKVDNDLVLHCTYKGKREVYAVEYKFNCQDNTFQISTPSIIELGPNIIANPGKVKEAYFYFYMEGVCYDCNNTSVSSVDLELDRSNNCIQDIGLERENFYLFDTEDSYHITTIHDRNIMLVSRCHFDETGGFSEYGKPVELPLVKLDLTDQLKTASKIKTLILFS